MKRTTRLSLAAAALVVSGIAPALSAEPGKQYRYTDLRSCKVVEKNRDEGGYVRSVCNGLGGFKLDVVEADGRIDIAIVSPKGRKQSLRLPSHFGGGFSSLGETIEWRGRMAAKTLQPTAMIVRYKVVEDFSKPERPTSYLLVVSLRGKPCLAAKIAPGSNQNQRARAAADGKLSCLPSD